MAKPPRDLLARSLRFSSEVVAFVEREQRRRVISLRTLDQLLRAGTSIGAQNAEAESALTRRHLLALRGRALQEAQETQYWLKLIAASEHAESADRLAELLGQVSELVAILTTCVKRLQA